MIQGVIAQVEAEDDGVKKQEEDLRRDISEWKGLIAEMETAAARARRIEEVVLWSIWLMIRLQEEREFHETEKQRLEEQLEPLRGINKARQQEAQEKVSCSGSVGLRLGSAG